MNYLVQIYTLEVVAVVRDKSGLCKAGKDNPPSVYARVVLILVLAIR